MCVLRNDKKKMQAVPDCPHYKQQRRVKSGYLVIMKKNFNKNKNREKQQAEQKRRKPRRSRVLSTSSEEEVIVCADELQCPPTPDIREENTPPPVHQAKKTVQTQPEKQKAAEEYVPQKVVRKPLLYPTADRVVREHVLPEPVATVAEEVDAGLRRRRREWQVRQCPNRRRKQRGRKRTERNRRRNKAKYGRGMSKKKRPINKS